MSVFVCGSLHHDVVVDAPHLPRLDETVTGAAVSYILGGKGGNQAVAAARLGAKTAFAGRIGDDAAGNALLNGLRAAGVDTSQVQRGSGASGMSVAIVEPGGGYGAVIVSAANLGIDPERIDIPPETRVVVLQNEIPEAVNIAIARRARSMGASVILNAAPARPMAAELLGAVDVLVVNRVEAEDLLSASDSGLDPVYAAITLSALGPSSIIITLGGEGLVLHDGARAAHHPGHSVQVVSTHGAGDAFVGALAASISLGLGLADAAQFGQAAAALHVASPIGQRSAINREKVEAMLSQASIR